MSIIQFFSRRGAPSLRTSGAEDPGVDEKRLAASIETEYSTERKPLAPPEQRSGTQLGAEAEAAAGKAHHQYRTLVNFLEDAAAQLERLRADHADKASALLKHATTNQNLSETIRRLEAQLAERNAEHDALLNDFESVDTQREQLLARVEIAEHDRDELKPFKTRCYELEKSILVIRAELDQVQQEQALLQQQHDSLRFQKAQLEKEYYEEKSKSAAREEAYERRDSERVAEISQLNQAISRLSQKATGLETDLAEATQNLQSTQAREAALNENLQRLRNEHTVLSGNSIRMKKEYMSQLSEVNEFLSKEKVRSEFFQEKISKLEEAGERAVKREQILRDEAFVVRAELKEIKSSLYEKEKLIKSLVGARDKAAALWEERQQEIQNLTAQNDELSQQIASMHSASERDAARLERLEDERRSSKKHADDLANQNDELLRERDGLRSERALLLGQLSHYRAGLMSSTEPSGYEDGSRIATKTSSEAIKESVAQ